MKYIFFLDILNPIAFSQPPKKNCQLSPGDKSLTRLTATVALPLPRHPAHFLSLFLWLIALPPPVACTCAAFRMPVHQSTTPSRSRHPLFRRTFRGICCCLADFLVPTHSFRLSLPVIFPVHPADISASSFTFPGGRIIIGCRLWSMPP